MGLQSYWGPLVAWYLFLAGTGAGSYIIAVIADNLGDRYQPVAKIGVYLGAPLVIIGSLLLLLDLGYPTRFFLGFSNLQSSMMSIGMIVITVFIFAGMVHLVALFFFGRTRGAPRWLGRINIIFAFGTAIYTGLLLGTLRAIPFWNTPILPMIFLFSSLSTGIGAIALSMGLWRWINPAAVNNRGKKVIASSELLSRFEIPVLLAEALAIFFLMFTTASSTGVMAISANYLLRGDYALAFWLGLGFIGLLVPLVLELWSFSRRKKPSLTRLTDLGVASGLCLLFGGVVLRYAILSAGASMSFPLHPL